MLTPISLLLILQVSAAVSGAWQAVEVEWQCQVGAACLAQWQGACPWLQPTEVSALSVAGCMSSWSGRVDGVLLHIGLVSALNVRCLCSEYDSACAWVQDHPSPSREPCLLLGSPFSGSICFSVHICQSFCSTGHSVKGHKGWAG